MTKQYTLKKKSSVNHKNTKLRYSTTARSYNLQKYRKNKTVKKANGANRLKLNNLRGAGWYDKLLFWKNKTQVNPEPIQLQLGKEPRRKIAASRATIIAVNAAAKEAAALEQRITELQTVNYELKMSMNPIYQNAGETNFTHLWYKAWPDHGAPKDYHIFRKYLLECYYAITKNKKDETTVIHCSAGVGRSGTIYILLQCMFEYGVECIYEKTPAESSSDLSIDTVINMITIARQYRVLIVQTVEQFRFILMMLGLTSTLSKSSTLTEKEQEEQTGADTKYNALTKIKYEASEYAKTRGKKEDDKNKKKNRFGDILPYEKNIPETGAGVDNEYINASVMEPFKLTKNGSMEFKVILAQGPIKSTLQAFYKMLNYNNVKTIIMLTRLNEKGKEKCAAYISNTSKLMNDKPNDVNGKYDISKLELTQKTDRTFTLDYIEDIMAGSPVVKHVEPNNQINWFVNNTSPNESSSDNPNNNPNLERDVMSAKKIPAQIPEDTFFSSDEFSKQFGTSGWFPKRTYYNIKLTQYPDIFLCFCRDVVSKQGNEDTNTYKFYILIPSSRKPLTQLNKYEITFYFDNTIDQYGTNMTLSFTKTDTNVCNNSKPSEIIQANMASETMCIIPIIDITNIKIINTIMSKANTSLSNETEFAISKVELQMLNDTQILKSLDSSSGFTLELSTQDILENDKSQYNKNKKKSDTKTPKEIPKEIPKKILKQYEDEFTELDIQEKIEYINGYLPPPPNKKPDSCTIKKK